MATALIHVPIHRPKRQLEAVRGSHLAACSMALVLAGVIALPELANAQTVLIRPQVDARLAYSDNVRAGDDGQEDWSAELSPGISILRESGRFSGNLSARLRNVVHANETDRNDTFLALLGRGRIEAVERFLFVDMDASASRNNRSQLSGRRAGDPLDTDSSNETRTIGIGPRLEFMLGPETTGMVSYMSRWLSGNGSIDGRREADWRALLANPVQFGRIGWGLAYTRSDTDYGDSASNAVSEETARATLFATVTPQFRLRGIVGYESNDYEVRSGEHSTIVGGGFDWHPTERTEISATTEKRIFGRGYDLRFSHRGARSSWNLTYSRDISSSLQAQGLDVFGDPEFRALYDALANGIPDPIEREAFVRVQLGYPAIGQRDSFLTNARFLNRSLVGSVSLIGVRNVVTIVVQQSERSRLGGAVTSDPLDDFARFDTVTTRSATAAFSHRLSQLSSLNATVLRSRAKGSGESRADTERTVLSIGVSTQFGPDTSGGLTYTHQRSEGQSDFIENVLTASVSMGF